MDFVVVLLDCSQEYGQIVQSAAAWDQQFEQVDANKTSQKSSLRSLILQRSTNSDEEEDDEGDEEEDDVSKYRVTQASYNLLNLLQNITGTGVATLLSLTLEREERENFLFRIQFVRRSLQRNWQWSTAAAIFGANTVASTHAIQGSGTTAKADKKYY